jgi:hypothetical protein
MLMEKPGVVITARGVWRSDFMATKTKGKKKRAKSKTTARMTAARKKTLTTKAGKHRKVAATSVRKKKRTAASTEVSSRQARARSGRQAGDLEGLSRAAGADSESVAELLEEGNAFEAEAVSGVEAADEEGEVRTHEVPEDDVPEEYLDKD